MYFEENRLVEVCDVYFEFDKLYGYIDIWLVIENEFLELVIVICLLLSLVNIFILRFLGKVVFEGDVVEEFVDEIIIMKEEILFLEKRL